jgi:hypothetical protein
MAYNPIYNDTLYPEPGGKGGSSSNWMKNLGMGTGAASMGMGLAGLLGLGGGKNPASAAMPYLNNAQGQISPYYDPWINSGQWANSQLQDQYSSLLNDPGAKFNQMGESFQQSPGFDFAMQQALQGAGHAEAAGGMAGSPQHEQENEQLATNLANQDYYNYMNNVEGLYGMGLQGTQGMSQMGLNASSGMADQIAHILAMQAGLSYSGQANKNQADSAFWGDLLGGAGELAAFAFL